MTDLVPTEHWFTVLGVALGVYGAIVAGGAATGYLAAQATRWLVHSPVVKAAAWLARGAARAYRWARARLHRTASATVNPAAVFANTGVFGGRTLKGEMVFSPWPESGTIDEQTGALAARTDVLRLWINLHIAQMAKLSEDADALTVRLDKLAVDLRNELVGKLEEVQTQSAHVNAAGLPGIALSIVITGLAWRFDSPAWWAWVAFAGFVAAAVIHVAWTMRSTGKSIVTGWRMLTT